MWRKFFEDEEEREIEYKEIDMMEEDDEPVGPPPDHDDDPLASDSEDDDPFDHVTDTTAEQARRGKDVQGIPWERLHFTREKYRETRIQHYKNYQNLEVSLVDLHKSCKQHKKDFNFFEFQHNTRVGKSTIYHFQLRNLIWASSKHDVYVLYQYGVNHWSPLSRKLTPVLNVAGPVVPHTEVNRDHWMAGQAVGRIQITTMCRRKNLLVAGGFHGEMVCKNLDSAGVAYSGRVTQDDNAITNAIDIFDTPSGSTRVMTSNNDCLVRVFDGETFGLHSRFTFPWPVNHTCVSPDGKVVLVVGDDPDGFLVDSESGKILGSLKGHLDYSFATAWHPDGNLFATGNQDMTCRVWDLRKQDSALFALKGRIGAIRSIRFSDNGRFMAIAEPADFVHVFDVSRGFERSQEIDLFGEIAGISFSPDTEALFVGISDRTYGSLLEYNRQSYYGSLESSLW